MTITDKSVRVVANTSFPPSVRRQRQKCFSLSTEVQHLDVSNRYAFRVCRTFVILHGSTSDHCGAWRRERHGVNFDIWIVSRRDGMFFVRLFYRKTCERAEINASTGVIRGCLSRSSVLSRQILLRAVFSACDNGIHGGVFDTLTVRCVLCS